MLRGLMIQRKRGWGDLPGSTWWSGASWWLLLMEKPAGGRFTPKAVRYFLINVHEGLTEWSRSE